MFSRAFQVASVVCLLGLGAYSAVYAAAPPAMRYRPRDAACKVTTGTPTWTATNAVKNAERLTNLTIQCTNITADDISAGAVKKLKVTVVDNLSASAERVSVRYRYWVGSEMTEVPAKLSRDTPGIGQYQQISFESPFPVGTTRTILYVTVPNRGDATHGSEVDSLTFEY